MNQKMTMVIHAYEIFLEKHEFVVSYFSKLFMIHLMSLERKFQHSVT